MSLQVISRKLALMQSNIIPIKLFLPNNACRRTWLSLAKRVQKSQQPYIIVMIAILATSQVANASR